jgi:hypothetical protein
MDPNQVQYEPYGIWLPFRDGDAGKLYTSHGILRVETMGGVWDRYLLVSRDGYVEYGTFAGYTVDERLYLNYAPIVAWIQRFAAFLGNLQDQLLEPADFWVVLNIPRAAGVALGTFGAGWPDISDSLFRRARSRGAAIEDSIQLSHRLGEDDPKSVAAWFAERLANAFGYLEARCYNRTATARDGEVGELPRSHRNMFL